MTTQAPRHKVFISFHHDDQKYKDRFVEMMEGNFVDKSVHDDDIDDTNLATETIRRKIREEFIADATVTVVLIGPCTWQRKHVDWEIGSSLRATEDNPRCGLVGILLPNHISYPDYPKANRQNYLRLIPPRLADNLGGLDPYANICLWPQSGGGVDDIRSRIHSAFQRREGTPPNNARQQFKRNRGGDCSQGWQ